jgi:methionyl-tRNA synthetase
MRPFYITTPIYYVNDVPHLGHAYTTIACDAIARFHRMRGDDTYFLTGTDEHGQKVEEAAQQRGLTAKELVDQVAPRFEETWKKLGIQNDYFVRTTSERHKAVVAALWKRMAANGDLYLGAYEGWYCVGCEAFYTESQLEKVADVWSCTTHKRPVQWIAKERSWFFRMSKYAGPLLAHIEKHPEFIQPDGYRNEVLSFVRGGLRDLSVSRTSFAWGIPVPQPDPEGQNHVIFVWVDALTNYMSALCDGDGEIGGELYDRFWPSAIHMIGKDILRFHAVYWPTFLLSAGLPLPKQIFTHGWWTVRGEKISKSMPATKIDPIKLSEALGAQTSFELGVDAMRYYLLREVPLGHDGDFTFESLFGRYNAELANDLGNLVNRSLTLVPRLMAEATVKIAEPLRARDDEVRLAFAAGNAVREAATLFEAMAPGRALEAIWRLVREANRYVDAVQPWRVATQSPPEERGHVAFYMLAALQTIGRLIFPVLPATSRLIRQAIVDCDPGQPEKTLQQTPAWPDEQLGADLEPRPVTKPTVLFPRLDDARQDEIVAMVAPSEAKKTQKMGTLPLTEAPEMPDPDPASSTSTSPSPSTITFDDFKKVELRVGQVIAAQAVPKAKKLLQLTMDLGEGRHRTVVAGIAEAYPPEALVGRKLIVVMNLAPATIRGITSEGMILAAGDEAILGLSALDRDVPVGTRVR